MSKTSTLDKPVSRRDFLKTATRTTAKIAIGAAGASSILATLSPAGAAGTLVNQYNFENNLNDTVGGKNGTGSGSPTYVAGHAGQAVNLSGATQYVSLPAGIVSTLNDFTIATWVKLTALSTWARIFDFGSNTTTNMFLVPSSGTTIRFAITTSGSGGEQRINGTANLATGAWVHVAVTLAGTTGTLYVNGAQVGQNTAMTLKPSSLGNTTLNYLGKSQYADPYLNGQLDDFRIYNGALTAGEVFSLYNPGGPTPTTGPTATRTNTPTPAPTPVPGAYLNLLYPEAGWKLNSTFWNERVKPLITNWIPWCYNQLNNTSLAEGGIENFNQAARKLQGLSAAAHVGYWFSNAYVHNVLQSMCRAVMLDAQGDSAMVTAQNNMRNWISGWIPKILAAQHSDGYLHTWTTLGTAARWTDRAAHEGYTAGYFIEAAIAHYQMTNFTDPVLFNAAKKLADCWVTNIGPSPKRTWWDGHQEMEQALTRFSRFCGALGDSTRASQYASLAKFLLDSRFSSSSGTYDQSHAYPVNQTTAVGHAVRAMYMYSGMTDVAMIHNSTPYFNAVNTIWDNFVNRKYYLAGGVGSGESSEGFGGDYSLPQNSYCETCAGTGNLFFQHMMHLAYADGKYVDLYEEALYNNIVGTMDTAGNNFEYTNPLDQNFARGNWHNCPCCVGNFPRTILTMPSWMYSKGNNSLYVNLFVGSVVTFNNVFGSTGVTLTQATNYPWDGSVTLTVSPTTPTAFTLYIRSPQRSVSNIYSHSPSSDGITTMAVNGTSVSTAATKGYVAINRTWSAGDQVTFTLPLQVQRVKAISNIASCSGRVALQRGPIIFNIEAVDHGNVDPTTLILPAANALTATWDGALLGGCYKITGNFTTRALVAVPHYKRRNRGGRTIVWMRDV